MAKEWAPGKGPQHLFCAACGGTNGGHYTTCSEYRGSFAAPADPPANAGVGALARQEGGAHYKGMKIQPFEYIHANGLPFAEGCVVKYVSRWRSKGGVEDLKKARHFLDLLIEAEGGKP